MFSSGMKRGLAAAAVSAMTVTGLQALTSAAFANPGTAQAGGADAVALAEPGVVGNISTKSDGANTTYKLEAAGGANVASVRFEYQIGAGQFNAIATVTRNDSGFFGTEWSAAGLDGASVTVRATALNSSGSAGATDSFTATVDSTTETVDVADGTGVGVFQQPYAGENATGQLVRLRGTVSQSALSLPSVTGFVWNGGTQSFDNKGTLTTSGGAPASYDGLVNIAGSYTYGSTDELLLAAGNGSSSDAEGFTLYKQTITQVSAVADRTNIPNGSSATVTVTVLDQNNQPVGGAQVYSSNGGAAAYTDAQGRATFSQAAGAAYYYANATDSNPYEAELGDKQSNTITVTQYAARPSALVASSADKSAFDFDEYSSGDIAVQVQDQNGVNYDPTAQTVTYHWVISPFAGGADVTTPDQVQAVDTAGRYVVEFPSGRPAGTYRLVASLGADALGNGAVAEATLLTVKAGQAAITFDQSSPEQAAAGTQEVVAGKLVLADGTALPDRLVNVSYATAAGNAGIVQADGTSGASRQVSTDATGAFSVTVRDVVANPQPNENGTVTAATGNTPNGSFPANNAQASNTSNVQFLASLAPTNVTVTPTAGGSGKPGVARSFTVHVDNASGPAANVSVSVALDHGFFTDGTADPAAAAGADAGELKSLGSNTTITTNGQGDATVQASIERDAGFDDDGLVTAALTARAGGVSGTANQVYDSSNPLNGGTVDIKRSSTQTVGVLPKAPTNESVAYDVYATDQFGNLTDSAVAVTAGGTGEVNGSTSDTVTAEYLGDGATVDITADTAGNQAPVATWTAPTTKYAGTPLAPVSGTEVLTDTGETTNWYVINFNLSKFTLTHDTANTVPVGQTVIETYTATDQNGEPIRGQAVQFFRSGPDVLQDGTQATNTFNSATGENGKAQYLFSGAAAGTATIQGIIADANLADEQSDNAPVGVSRATDQVSFTAPSVPTTPPTSPVAIEAALKGKSAGSKDKITVAAGSAAKGATATLYAKGKGGLKKLKSKTLNSAGKAKLSVKDRNGADVTKYVVKVAPTSTSQADKSKINLK